MCKGEHTGVRTIVVRDFDGQIVKRGKCVPGNLLDLGGHAHGGTPKQPL